MLILLSFDGALWPRKRFPPARVQVLPLGMGMGMGMEPAGGWTYLDLGA